MVAAPSKEAAGLAAIRQFTREGHEVLRFSDHHYRIAGVVDFWPSSLKWRFAKPPHASGKGIDGLRAVVFKAEGR